MTEAEAIKSKSLWISPKMASKIVNLGYHRTIVFLTRPSVRSRKVPWGPNRSTYQYWLPDVLALSKTEAETIAHEEELKDILREEARQEIMRIREQEEIDDIHRREREQDECPAFHRFGRNYQDYLEEIRQEQNV